MCRWRFSSASFFLIIMFLFETDVSGKTRIWLRELGMCDKNYDYPIKFESTNTISNGRQVVNLTGIVNTPLGLDQSMNATFEVSPNGKMYMPLFKISRPNLCDFLNKDIGAFWFEIQAQIAIPQKMCPVQIGRYNLRNFELPYNKLSIPLPSGFIRNYIYIIENKTKRVVSCIYDLLEIIT